nr:hypothetical protein CFP56_77506 [Quercus suber]
MLGTPASIDEASQWKPPLDKKLALASAYMSSTFPAEYGTSHGRGDLKFLEYTTLSFDQIGQRALSLPIGDYTRNKKDHLAMFADRIEKKPGTATFLADSIKGVKDIMRQQVSQGKIGDMSRVARISAMCFVRGRSGGTYVIGRNSRVLLNRNTAPSTGCPAVRCIMVLCQASQQAALDAHRVGSTQSTGIDMIADMLNGRLDTGENVARSTLYCFSGMGVAEVKQDLGCTFCCRVDDVVIAVAPDDAGSAPVMKHLVAAYSPVVLSRVPVGARRGTCKKGITVVLNYYSLRLENDDIEDLVEAMSYRVQASRYPITTREGMLKRGLGWMETLMACDYTKLPLLAGSASGALSATSATMCANFASL